jgi:soluble lytic murein transglycosylase-like protein
MINRFTSASAAARTYLASQPATSFLTTRVSARGIFATAQHTLTILGVTALVVMAVFFARPDLAKALSDSLNPAAVPKVEAVAVVAPPLSALMPPSSTRAPIKAGALADSAAAPLSADEKAIMGTQKQQQWVTSWLSKRYRVAGDAANMLVSTAYLTAREIKLDPLLILAVMAIESGLNPFAESPVGAQGLMQVMSKIHHDKFQEMGGLQAALNPVANIRVGSLILKDYVTRGGSVEAGLKIYVGAAAFEHDDGYGSKVMAEYNRLKQVSAGKKVPTITPMMASAAPKPQQLPQQQQQQPSAPIAATASADNDSQIAGL